jgi:nucleoside-diphosphate-sugar epimerase
MFAALPQTERAWRRLDAENTLRAFARRHGSQLTILRAPGIYALERLPLTRLMQNTPLIRPEEDSYSNHIHADDLASLCIASLQQNRGGIRVYNACDQEPLTITDWYRMLADALSCHCRHNCRVPRCRPPSARRYGLIWPSHAAFAISAWHELGVALRYPTAREFVAQLAANPAWQSVALAKAGKIR